MYLKNGGLSNSLIQFYLSIFRYILTSEEDISWDSVIPNGEGGLLKWKM